MDIQIINISKGPYDLNEDAIKALDITKLSFNVSSRLKYSKESDYTGFQIDLAILQENTQIFKSGFLIGMAIRDWAKDLRNGLDLNANREKLHDICKSAWLIATGIVALQSSTADFPGIILPSINCSELSKDVLLILNDTK